MSCFRETENALYFKSLGFRVCFFVVFFWEGGELGGLGLRV